MGEGPTTTVLGVLLDLDGVVYRGEDVVPGAPDAIAQLRSRGTEIVAVTNHSGRTPAGVASKLRSLGIEFDAEAVVTSAVETARYLVHAGIASARVVGTAALREALREAGIRVGDGLPQAVVVGYAPDATFAELAAAARDLRDGATFVATNRDGAIPMNGSMWPEAGPTVAFLEVASGCVAHVVGKPGPGMFEEGLRRLGLPATSVVMIGDTLETDVGGGRAAGCRTLWIGTDPEPYETVAEQFAPSWSAPSLVDGVRLLEDEDLLNDRNALR